MTYSARIIRREIEVDANSLVEAKTVAIEKFKELLEKDELKLEIEEELDSYDWRINMNKPLVGIWQTQFDKFNDTLTVDDTASHPYKISRKLLLKILNIAREDNMLKIAPRKKRQMVDRIEENAWLVGQNSL